MKAFQENVEGSINEPRVMPYNCSKQRRGLDMPEQAIMVRVSLGGEAYYLDSEMAKVFAEELTFAANLAEVGQKEMNESQARIMESISERNEAELKRWREGAFRSKPTP